MSEDNGHERSAAAARFAERAVGERGEAGRGVRGASGSPPDPELVERPRRRRFTAKYKLGILEQADACTRPGEVGELLRREGRYTSHLTYWRKQRKDGALKGTGPFAEVQAGRPTARSRSCAVAPSARRPSFCRPRRSSRSRECHEGGGVR